MKMSPTMLTACEDKPPSHSQHSQEGQHLCVITTARHPFLTKCSHFLFLIVVSFSLLLSSISSSILSLQPSSLLFSHQTPSSSLVPPASSAPDSQRHAIIPIAQAPTRPHAYIKLNPGFQVGNFKTLLVGTVRGSQPTLLN